MTPALKLRREATHDARNRQLPRVLRILAFACSIAGAFAEAPSRSLALEELHAAKLLESALFARTAGTDEWRKLDEIYAGLATKYPRDAEVKNGHAEFLWSRGEQERAMTLWTRASELDPANAVVLEHLAGGFLAAGDVKKSAAFYARAVEHAPQNAAVRFALANVTYLFRHELLDAARPTEAVVLAHALALFAEASRLAPLNTEYARSYAETFYMLPRPDWTAALAAWQRFLEISTQKDFAFANLARVHLNLGEKDAAKACLDRIQSAEFKRLKAKLAGRIEAESSAPDFPKTCH